MSLVKVGLLCVGSLGVALGMVRGDHRHQCECLVRLAGDLRDHGRELQSEFRGTYRSTPQYGALQAQARDLVTRACRLQALARAGKSYHELHGEAESISRVHSHLVQTVRKADASCGVGYPGPSWRYGNVPSKNAEVQHLLSLTHSLTLQIDSAIHELEDLGYSRRDLYARGNAYDHDDYGRDYRQQTFRPQLPPESFAPQYPQYSERQPFHPGPTGFRYGPPADPGQGGISIGNGRFTFQWNR